MTIYKNSEILQFSRIETRVAAGPIGRAIMYKSGVDACFAIRLIGYFPEDTTDTLTVRYYSKLIVD